MFRSKEDEVELFDVRPASIHFGSGLDQSHQETSEEDKIRLKKQRNIKNVISDWIWRVSETLLFLVLGSFAVYYPSAGLIVLVQNILHEYIPDTHYGLLERYTLYLFALLCIYIHTNTIKRHIELILCERRCVEMGVTDFLYRKIDVISDEAERNLLQQKWFSYIGRTIVDRLKDSAFGLSLYFLIVFNVTIFFSLMVVMAIPIIRLVYRQV